MAYVRKVRGKWKAEIERAGVRMSRTFTHKKSAAEWAAKEEAAIIDGKRGIYPDKTVADAFDRYEKSVTAGKRGKDKESLRFVAIQREFPELCSMVISEVKTPDLVAWRDARLQVVTKGTVQRDINLLRNVWNVAAKEWHWCSHPTPWLGLKMPGDNPPRKTRWHWQDVRRIARWLGYQTGQPPKTKYQEVAYAFLIALGSAMRASEILNVTLDRQRRVGTLDGHKTLESEGVRHVPLPPRSARLLGLVPGWTINTGSLDALFRKARDANLIEGLTFHDSRGSALTMLAKRVDVLVLAKISGHRDLNLLLETYYRATPEEIAARL
jgi:integrase